MVAFQIHGRKTTIRQKPGTIAYCPDCGIVCGTYHGYMQHWSQIHGGGSRDKMPSPRIEHKIITKETSK